LSNLDLGLIGNCSYAALIDSRAAVVWACMPRFDGDPVFCALLRGDNAPDTGFGLWAIDLVDFSHSEQCYFKNTAILITTLYDRHGGVVEVTDFAPRFKHYERTFRPMTMVRRLRPLAGSPRVRVRLRPAFEYGASRPSVTHGSNHIRFVGPDQVLRLYTDGSATTILDELPFVLEEEMTMLLGPDETLTAPISDTGRRMFNATRDYWQEWVRYLAIPYEWQESVIRAAITLKLNAYEDTGAIIAAVTTSIPEHADSGRNWDYRYCWLRDAYFVVNALNRLGATKTMEDYLRYIINVAAGSPDADLRPVYRINGRCDLQEYVVESLPGYRGMGPVRVGNQAYEQNQHDVYGSTVLAAAHVFFDQRIRRPGDESLFRRLEALGERAIQLYDRPDAGLWEFRGIARVHTFSSVMCWVACKTLARIAHRLGLDERSAYWARNALTIAKTIEERAWNPERNAFMGSFGGNELDASLLLLAELGFLRADDPRFAGTVAAIEKDLRRGDFIFRYVEEDDFGEPANAFTTCTFWYIEALVALGRRAEAREVFESLLACRNRLGLLSEDIDPRNRELWGNFPQTYCMVGLVTSATRLSKPWEEAY
jgi:GH15 family glucan-1,4-alpha-glucosidase